MINKLLDNPVKVIIAVVLFVLLFLFLLSKEARSEEIYFDAGSAMVRGYTPAIGLNIAWKEEGPKKTDYELGFKLIGQSEYKGEDQSNQFVVHGMLVDGYKNFEMGMGFAYFNVESDYTCQFTYSLLARYRFTQRIHAQWHHFSTAGSCDPNPGRDLLTLGWRF
jgi:hypothetical protein